MPFMTSDWHDYIDGLIRNYPTEQIMRRKADQLESASTGPNVPRIVDMMRRLADLMESGAMGGLT